MTKMFRVLFLAIACWGLVGCLTIPINQASNVDAKKTITEEQTNLRIAKRALDRTARKQGWYEESTGLFAITEAIMRGIAFYQTDLNVYAKHIKVSKGEPSALYETILDDIKQANQLLVIVSLAVEKIIANQVEISQKDISNTETALSIAQLAIQNFEVTIEIVSEKAPVPDSVSFAMSEFKHEIEKCHILSEHLARGYFNESQQES